MVDEERFPESCSSTFAARAAVTTSAAYPEPRGAAPRSACNAAAPGASMGLRQYIQAETRPVFVIAEARGVVTSHDRLAGPEQGAGPPNGVAAPRSALDQWGRGSARRAGHSCSGERPTE
jgi:hypothetical protein